MEENYTHGKQETVKAQENGGLMKLKAHHQNYKGASRSRQSDISRNANWLRVKEKGWWGDRLKKLKKILKPKKQSGDSLKFLKSPRKQLYLIKVALGIHHYCAWGMWNYRANTYS